MRIFYAVPHPLTGAVRQRVLGVSAALGRADGVDEVILASPDMDPPLDELESPKVRYVRVEQRSTDSSVVEKILRRAFLGVDTVRALDRLKPDVVIGYGGGGVYMNRLQRWTRSEGAKFVADLVEWYDGSHLPLGRWGPLAWDNRRMMETVAYRSDGVIVISSYLERHFGDRNFPVLRVPPTLNMSAEPWGLPLERSRQRLVYCGSPGRKDRLDLVIQALEVLDPRGERFELLVAGPSQEELKRFCSAELPLNVSSVGQIEPAAARELVRSADWMPMIRQDAQYAHAGFPTKVAEALSAGTPVIANITSDLGDVLMDGRTAVVVSRPDLESVVAALERADGLGRRERKSMSTHARRVAEEYFDQEAYAVPLRQFIARVQGEAQ